MRIDEIMESAGELPSYTPGEIKRMNQIEATVIGAIVVVFAVVMLAIEITQPARERAAYEEGYARGATPSLPENGGNAQRPESN